MIRGGILGYNVNKYDFMIRPELPFIGINILNEYYRDYLFFTLSVKKMRKIIR